MIMMKIIYLLSFLLTLLNTSLIAQTTQRKILTPSVYRKEIAVNVEGKIRIYYLLDTKNKSVITVKGPGKLQLLTRAQFIPSQKGKLGYEIVYSINGGDSQRLKIQSVDRSTKATFIDGTLGVPGQIQETEILLGRGDHTIEFILPENSPGVVVRYQFTPTKEKKREWIGFYSAKSPEVVELVANESRVTYYRFSTEKPLKVEVIGPTELRVFTRVEFKYNMRGNVNYRIQVKNEDKVISTYQLSSRRSEVTTYIKEKELIPGKACEFIIDVPPGKQIYEIIPLDKDKNTILGRLMIPKKDVKVKN